jgi:hypothetical protein
MKDFSWSGLGMPAISAENPGALLAGISAVLTAAASCRKAGFFKKPPGWIGGDCRAAVGR